MHGANCYEHSIATIGMMIYCYLIINQRQEQNSGGTQHTSRTTCIEKLSNVATYGQWNVVRAREPPSSLFPRTSFHCFYVSIRRRLLAGRRYFVSHRRTNSYVLNYRRYHRKFRKRIFELVEIFTGSRFKSNIFVENEKKVGEKIYEPVPNIERTHGAF